MNQNWKKVECHACQFQNKIILELFLKVEGTPDQLENFP